MSDLRMPKSQLLSLTSGGASPSALVISPQPALCSPPLPKRPGLGPGLGQSSFFGDLLERLFQEACPDHHGAVSLPPRVTAGPGHASLGALLSLDCMPVCPSTVTSSEPRRSLCMGTWQTQPNTQLNCGINKRHRVRLSPTQLGPRLVRSWTNSPTHLLCPLGLMSPPGRGSGRTWEQCPVYTPAQLTPLATAHVT